MNKDDIFNSARKNMIPQKMWDDISDYPALTEYVRNHYYIEKAMNQKEVKILKNAYEESCIVGEYYFKLSKVFDNIMLDPPTNSTMKDKYLDKIKSLKKDREDKLDKLYKKMGIKK